MKNKRKRRICEAGFAMFLLLFFFSGFLLLQKLSDRKENSEAMESLASEVQRGVQNTGPPPEDGADTGPENREARLASYEELKKQNPDLAGWITIPETGIDYPVMQTKDRPDYYLKRGFDGSRNSHGVPYLAEDCDVDSGGNFIVYGHHMKDGSMFAPLMKYADKEFYEAHPVIQFDTLKECGNYEIIAVMKASASGKDPLFSLARVRDETEFDGFMKEIRQRSFYDTGAVISHKEQLITLITCEYTQDEGRLLVVGRKLE